MVPLRHPLHEPHAGYCSHLCMRAVPQTTESDNGRKQHLQEETDKKKQLQKKAEEDRIQEELKKKQDEDARQKQINSHKIVEADIKKA